MCVHDIARSSACPIGSASCKANARPETWRNLRRSTREGVSDAKETRTRAGREQTMLPMISAPFGAVTVTCSPPRAWAPATQDMPSANDGGQWSELCESEGKEWWTAGAARGKRRGDQDTTRQTAPSSRMLPAPRTMAPAACSPAPLSCCLRTLLPPTRRLSVSRGLAAPILTPKVHAMQGAVCSTLKAASRG